MSLSPSTLATGHRPLTTILPGIPKSAEALAVAELLASHSRILHIAVNDRAMETMEKSLAFFAPEAEVLRFPAWDCMPYDRASPLPALMAARMQTLAQLVSSSPALPQIILTTVSAALQKLPPREIMRNVMPALAPGMNFAQEKLIVALLAQGYHRSGKAMEPGEFAVRGGIVDIVPPDRGVGVRVDFFGDEIESLRPYDPLTQLTQGTLDTLTLFPVSEVLLNDDTRTRFRTRYREMFGAVTRDDPLYEAISAGQSYPGMEHWLPLFYENLETIFDYAPGALVTLDTEAETTLTERHETIRDYYDARKAALSGNAKKSSFTAGTVYHPVAPGDIFLMEESWRTTLDQRKSVEFSPFTAENETSYRPAIPFARNEANPFDELKNRIGTASKSTLLACFTEGSRERLQTLLMERDFHPVRIENWRERKNISGKSIGLCVLPIENGFETQDALILSEQDVLGERIARAKSRKKKSDVFLAEAANFTEGELVVHKEHGIGRFEGLETLTVSGAPHDCLRLIYEGGDKLFLPVENIEMVSRFGLDEEDAKLDKLGGASWQSRKAKLKEKILLAAEELFRTAAERQVKTGPLLEVQTGTYEEFCSRFPYVETEDQARAIDDVLADLRSGRPMDRLVCGDVGFGKTEVALRAAFAAVLNADGKTQVAIIVPTTLLARQHYANFKERFAGFPVTVRALSRMVPAKAQKETHTMIEDGTCDIVIGTHALLSKNTKFKNLGLVIVDEEQHFGVAQKEKLKSLKTDVHVLTLSATPIPRTLQMALTGVRDLSLITTPPIDRLAVRSFVMPFDPVVLAEAVARELHRGGRCFAVTPRIKDIGEFKQQLLSLVPDARIAIGHGQMPPAELDVVMNDFYDGKYDILLSTAIIESGLDIPEANTMIIHNAHLFGLSQLYQMRGRVGRAKLRAYAYFLLPMRRELTKNATRRLEVMQTLDHLGAGFTLASHDMDIRGFGNLVGEEQSGHIREVGIELYQQMLEEAVAALKSTPALVAGSGAPQDQTPPFGGDWSPSINLGLPVLIPETYVDDLSLRLGLYRRAASLSSAEDIDSFAAELTDRFGEQPLEVRYLISTLGIKLLCKSAGIERIDVGPKGAVISLRDNKFANPEALLTYVNKNMRALKIRPDQKIVYTHEWRDDDNKIASIRKLAAEIVGLIQNP